MQKFTDVRFLHLDRFGAVYEGMKKKKKSLYSVQLRNADDSFILDNDIESDQKTEAVSTKTLLREFSEQWTVHGPARIFAAKSWLRRLIWVLLWVFMLIWGSYQCYKVLLEFYQYPKSVSIEIVDDSLMEFPAVTVCSLNPFIPKDADNTYRTWHENEKNILWSWLKGLEEDFLAKDICSKLDYDDIYSYYYYYYDDDYYNYYNDYYNERTAKETKNSSGSYGETTGFQQRNGSEEKASETDTSRVYDYEEYEGKEIFSVTKRQNYKAVTTNETAEQDSVNDTSQVYDYEKYEDKGNFSVTEGQNYEAVTTNNSETSKNTQPRKKKKGQSIVQTIRKIKRLKRIGISSPFNEEEMFKHNMRTNCSLNYQRLYFLWTVKHGEPGSENILNDDLSNCREPDFKESYYLDLVCYETITIDKFGSYNSELNECDYEIKAIQGGIQSRRDYCTTCCAHRIEDVKDDREEVCIELKTDSLKEKYISGCQYLIQYSSTSDATDVMQNFLPQKQDFKNFINFSKNDTITTCSFDKTTCSHRDFEEWYSNEHGACYTFNSYFHQYKNSDKKLPVKKTRASGPGNGLRLTLNINSRNTLALLSTVVGAKVIVHRPDTLPFPEDEGITVPPGVSSDIEVKVKNIARAKPPHGKCEDLKLNTKYRYTKTLCRKFCLENEYRQKCNCSFGISPAYDELQKEEYLEPCNLLDVHQRTCMDNIKFNYFHRRRKCNCPQSCNENIYETSVAYNENNMDYYKIVQNIKQKSKGDDLCEENANGTVRVHVYLDKLSYEQVKETPLYTVESLIANLGGNFGLFVGLSVVSLIEMIEFLWDFLYFLYEKKIRRKKFLKEKKIIPVYLLAERSGDISHNDNVANMVLLSPSMDKRSRAQVAFNKMFID